MLRSRYVGALAPLLLVLSGCGSAEPDAAPPPKVSASPTPTPSTPPAPVMPDAAKADTKAGAVAFAKYYVDVLNHAQQTGDVEQLRAVIADTCESCLQVTRALEDIYGAGGHVEGGELLVTASLASSQPAPQFRVVTIAVASSPQRVVNGDGTTKELSGGKHTYDLRVTRSQFPKVLAWSRIA